MYIDNILIIII